MKLSLNELRVDSYATQLNEKEITEIKGGTINFFDLTLIMATIATLYLISQPPYSEPPQPTGGEAEVSEIIKD